MYDVVYSKWCFDTELNDHRNEIIIYPYPIILICFLFHWLLTHYIVLIIPCLVSCSDNKVYYSNRSAAYIKADSKSKALWDAQKCVELAPDWVKGYSRLGAAQQSLKRLVANVLSLLVVFALRFCLSNTPIQSNQLDNFLFALYICELHTIYNKDSRQL